MENTLVALNHTDDSTSSTALMHAVDNKYPLEALMWLVNSGSGLDERDRDGRTAAMHAVLVDYPVDQIVQLTSEATLNHEDHDGYTLLTLAAKAKPHVTESLFKALAYQYPNTLDVSRGANQLLLFAIKSGNEDLVIDLLRAGADARSRCSSGFYKYTTTPLLCAAQCPHTKASERILRRILNAILHNYATTV